MKKGIAGILLLAGAAFIFYSYNPATTSLFPRCPFLVLTGLKCPGCGSQRAIHCLLHLDIGGAFFYNALMVLSLPIVFILLYAELMRQKKPSFYEHLHKPAYIWIYFIIVLVWCVTRNIFNW